MACAHALYPFSNFKTRCFVGIDDREGESERKRECEGGSDNPGRMIDFAVLCWLSCLEVTVGHEKITSLDRREGERNGMYSTK